MAKQQQIISQRQINDHGKRGQELEHVVTTDDYPLPESEELEKLKRIDPTIIHWILDRAENEQKFRHANSNERLRITKKAVSGENVINVIGQFFGFIIVAGGLYFSYSLIQSGQNIFGSIFTGATLLAAASIFVPKKKR